MIKKFEQMEFNEDWEEDWVDDEKKPIYSECPFKLKYGKDGPEYKTGQRLKIYNNNGDFSLTTIVHFKKTSFGSRYVICFDKKITGHSVENLIYHLNTDLGYHIEL